MLGTSLKELVFIRICAFLLRFSVPSSFALLLAIYVVTGLSPLSILVAAGSGGDEADATTARLALRISVAFLSAVFVFDTAFFLGVYLPLKRWATQLRSEYPRPSLSPQERSTLFHKCLDNVPDPEYYLCQWFLGANLAEIRRENVRGFLTWAFFDRDADDVQHGRLSESEEAELNVYLDEIDRRLILSQASRGAATTGLQPGRGSAKSMRTNIDSIPMRFRSIIWYTIVMLVDVFTHVNLLLRGYRYYASPTSVTLGIFPPRPQLLVPSSLIPRQPSPVAEMGYWYRPHKSTTARPVVFIHGIGIGLLPYPDLLSEIANGLPGENDGHGQVGIIAVEILPVCMRLAGAPPDKERFLAQISTILDHHGWLDGDFTLVSHSYGSIHSTHMVKSPIFGPRIAAVVLIDPVSLLLHLPDVAYNFVRRTPHRANEVQLWFAASTDPGIALVLCRYFFWQQNIIWKEELLQRKISMPKNKSSQGPIRKRGPSQDQLTGRGAATTDNDDDDDDDDDYDYDDNGDGLLSRRKVVVALAGEDIVTDAKRIAEYLLCNGDLAGSTAVHRKDLYNGLMAEVKQGMSRCVTDSGFELLFYPALDHSQVVDRKAERRLLVRRTRASTAK